MQSLMGKERALKAIDSKRRFAKLTRQFCSCLPALFPAAKLYSSMGTGEFNLGSLILWSLAGASLYMHAGNAELDTDFEIMGKCVGRPHLAAAVTKQHPGQEFKSMCGRLALLKRLNGVQKDLLHEFFMKSGKIPEDDCRAAYSLLRRD